jgi:hypothetical protein
MSEKAMTPQEMFDMYQEKGRGALIEKLCVFNRKATNDVMERLIDCIIGGFKGDIPVSAFIEQMNCLNNEFYEVLTNDSLDCFNEGEIDGDFLAKELDELQEVKERLDKEEKTSL